MDRSEIKTNFKLIFSLGNSYLIGGHIHIPGTSPEALGTYSGYDAVSGRAVQGEDGQLQVRTSWSSSSGGDTSALYLTAPQWQFAEYVL